MDSQSQSAATGLSAILGAALGTAIAAYATAHGLPVTPDQGTAIVTSAAGAGAAVLGGIAHLVAGWLHKKQAATVLPPPAAAASAPAPVPPVVSK